MRLALLPALMLAIPLLSGCAGLVEEDPAAAAAALADEAEAYADEAEQAVENLPGHIAGTVVAANAPPIAGATVLLGALPLPRTPAADGSFAFVDLETGDYDLTAVADGFLESQSSASVQPGIFVRPSIVLEAVPAPEPYSEVFKFEGYADLAGPIGFSNCYCWFDFPLAEDLQDLVIEAVLDEPNSPFSSDWMTWYLSTYDEATEEGNSFGGQETSPMSIRLPGDEVGPASEGYLEVRPSGDLVPEFNRTFTAYVSAFYHGLAPEGYTAIVEE